MVPPVVSSAGVGTISSETMPSLQRLAEGAEIRRQASALPLVAVMETLLQILPRPSAVGIKTTHPARRQLFQVAIIMWLLAHSPLPLETRRKHCTKELSFGRIRKVQLSFPQQTTSF